MGRLGKLLTGAALLLLCNCTSDKATVIYKPGPAAPAGNNPIDSATGTPIARIKSPTACAPKEYPHNARMHEQQGTTVLLFLIDVDGKALTGKIGNSSGSPELDNAAIASFLDPGCQFYPVIVDGKPAKSWARIAYVWRLT